VVGAVLVVLVEEKPELVQKRSGATKNLAGSANSTVSRSSLMLFSALKDYSTANKRKRNYSFSILF